MLDGTNRPDVAKPDTFNRSVSRLANNRILVTGGADFIGSHLCDRLRERGHEVLCIDNFFTGSRVNVARQLQNPAFELMRQHPCECTMIGLAEAVLRLTQSSSTIVFKPLPPDDPQQRQPDIRRARDLLGGWASVTPLEIGLERTIAYFRQRLGTQRTAVTVASMP